MPPTINHFSFKKISEILFGVGALALVLLVSQADGAKSSAGNWGARVKTPVSGELWLRGTNDYSLKIYISQGVARLIAQKGHAASVYVTSSAHIDDGEVRAHFGGLGDLRMRFEQRKSEGRKSCPSGHGGHLLLGTFHGNLAFRGEAGFTQVSASKVSGSIGIDCRLMRKKAKGKFNGQTQGKRVAGFSLGGKGHTRFTGGSGAVAEMSNWEREYGVSLGSNAIAHSENPFSAMRSIQRGDLHIARLVGVAGTQDALSVGERGEATVRPGAPFVGEGHLAACRLSSWAGNLAVQFPGERIELTGPRFWVSVVPVGHNC